VASPASKRQFLRPLRAVGKARGHVEIDEGAQHLRMDETGDEVEQRLAILAGHAGGEGRARRGALERARPEKRRAPGIESPVRQAGAGGVGMVADRQGSGRLLRGDHRRQALRRLAHHVAKRGLPRTGRDRGDGAGQDILQPPDRALDAQLRHGVGATVDLILMGGLAQRFFVIERVTQIVGDLKRLPDAGAKLGPGVGSSPAAAAPMRVAAVNSAPVLAR
jgi:hypothetical protein